MIQVDLEKAGQGAPFSLLVEFLSHQSQATDPAMAILEADGLHLVVVRALHQDVLNPNAHPIQDGRGLVSNEGHQPVLFTFARHIESFMGGWPVLCHLSTMEHGLSYKHDVSYR